MFPAEQGFDSVDLFLCSQLRLVEQIDLAAAQSIAQIHGKRLGVIVVGIVVAQEQRDAAALFAGCHIFTHAADCLLKILGLPFFTAPDKRNIDQDAEGYIKKLQYTSRYGTGGLIAT